uniref:Serine/threonine protein kinase, putative nucleic acid-dependent ATPase, and abortive late protein homologue genes n=1 Tax=African swine fever virus TaxID=10497 RepID=Q65276_ASF|nr:putative [African swine fever virus]
MIHGIFSIFNKLNNSGSILQGFHHDDLISWNFFFRYILKNNWLPYLMTQKYVISSTTLKHRFRCNEVHVLRCGDPFHLYCRINCILCLRVF